MKLTIGEMAKLSGVSVRTLHYYDEIGLLKPSHISDAGYRYYDYDALSLLQQILLFRELLFPLCEIKNIINHPDYNRTEALERQKRLLTLKKERLERLILLAEKSQKGENIMNFEAFDLSEIEKEKEKYAKEAKEKWGSTNEYAQYSKKTSGYSKEDWQKIIQGAGEIFRSFAALKNGDPKCEASQELVRRWQQYISDNFYDCSNEILACLGEMYTADERFKENIDKYGTGTAEFMFEAIQYYCNK